MSKCDRVTITGADDSIDPAYLAKLSEKFPFVEWGILFSRTQVGTERFPSGDWIRELPPGLNYAAHLCGKFVRDCVLDAHFTWLDEPLPLDLFQRVQLNFHGQFHKQHRDLASVLLGVEGKSYILQCDNVNDQAVRTLCAESDRLTPLFDTSGGAGILPQSWPDAWPGIYCGYAGGLGPDNVSIQLDQIGRRSPDQPFWIDMERRVRSVDDTIFDLERVQDVLTQCARIIG